MGKHAILLLLSLTYFTWANTPSAASSSSSSAAARGLGDSTLRTGQTKIAAEAEMSKTQSRTSKAETSPVYFLFFLQLQKRRTRVKVGK